MIIENPYEILELYRAYYEKQHILDLAEVKDAIESVCCAKDLEELGLTVEDMLADADSLAHDMRALMNKQDVFGDIPSLREARNTVIHQWFSKKRLEA